MAAFLEKGYANTTLDDVIARSGGSRQTLYALFGGKQGLFEALVAERSNRIFAQFDAEKLRDMRPDDVLVGVGIRYLETVTAPDVVGVYRLILAESRFIGELANRFWATGPGHARALLAGYFALQTRRGTLDIPDPEQAARQFWGMLMGTFQMECLLGLRDVPGAGEIEAFVRAAVARFLDGCRA